MPDAISTCETFVAIYTTTNMCVGGVCVCVPKPCELWASTTALVCTFNSTLMYLVFVWSQIFLFIHLNFPCMQHMLRRCLLSQ